jgi:hypothetical protein
MEHDWLIEEAEEAYLLGFSRPGTCMCGRDVEHLFATPSRTMYQWDGEGEDPNADKDLCLDCSIEYSEIMEDPWREYYEMTR